MTRGALAVSLLLLFPCGSGASAIDPTPLRARPLAGRLDADGWFADRPLIAFSADGAWLVLGDRFGRSVSAFDLDGGDLWSIPVPAGRELRALALDAAGRLFAVPSGGSQIWIYDRPSAAPSEVEIPGGSAWEGEVSLYRSADRVVLCAAESPVRYWLDGRGNVAATDTMPRSRSALLAHGPRGVEWTYKNGDRRIRGGEGGKMAIALDAPLSTRAALAVNEDGIVWVYEGATGRLDGYTPNGFLQRSFRLEPPVEDPEGLWVDPAGGFWIGNRSRGRFARYVP